MKRIEDITLTICVSILMVSCASMEYTVLRPIYPEASSVKQRPHTVETLQPTLEWGKADNVVYENIDFDCVTFDLAIWEGVRSHNEWVWGMPGKQVYYREGIRDSKHTVRISLEPNTLYYWSVRIRTEDGVTEWSQYHSSYGGTGSWLRNAYFRFFTPSKE